MNELSNLSKSVEKIQLLWRSYCNKRIYRYLRQILLEKLQGAPCELLRVVVADEICLFDKSAGIHIKFRLGGQIFPPKIYFKVFTHQPLCDIGAFAPRVYNQEKLLPRIQCLSKSSTSYPSKNQNQKIRVGMKYFDTNVTTTVNIDKWYKREENNPWRPIISSKLHNLMTPPWIQGISSSSSSPSSSPQPFHFNRWKRKEDRIKHRKQRKREWLMKAYMYASQINEIENNRLLFEEIEHRQRLIENKSVMSPINDDIHSSSSPLRGYEKDVSLTQYSIPLGSNSSSHSHSIDNSHDHDHQGLPLPSSSSFIPNKLVPSDWHEDDDLFFNNPSNGDEDLLKWSLTLDYEDYYNNWRSLGNSMSSHVPMRRI